MTSLRTTNRRRLRKRKRAVYLAAFQYHQARVERLTRAGRTDQLAKSSYARRQCRKQKP